MDGEGRDQQLHDGQRGSLAVPDHPGVKPIFYLEVGSGPSYRLVDGFLKDFAGITEYLRVNGDYPLGTYSYNGSVSDTMGGEARRSRRRCRLSARTLPAAPGDHSLQEWEQAGCPWSPGRLWYHTDQEWQIHGVTKLPGVPKCAEPYFTPNIDPGDSAILLSQFADHDYLHRVTLAQTHLTNYFYIVRTVNALLRRRTPSRWASSAFELVPGQ